MKIRISAVGRLGQGPFADLFDLYFRRITWPITVTEIEIRQALPPDRLAEAESERLMAGLTPGSMLVALDETGRNLSSQAFARRIEEWQMRGVSEIAFAIGGPDGHAQALRDRADLIISFGQMTWPHKLARVMLVEQIYRAQQILAGHPYHRA